jgi:hypothetical protein
MQDLRKVDNMERLFTWAYGKCPETLQTEWVKHVAKGSTECRGQVEEKEENKAKTINRILSLVQDQNA